MDLNIIWFLLIGVLITGYAILDGFDLGIGSLFYILGKTNDERKTLINSIAPVWDGNEVWLLTGAGALFAAFPMVYATVFSGFYLAIMLALFGLIFRAVSIEYYFKVGEYNLQKLLGRLFFVGSLVPALLFGVAVGNIVGGVPLDANTNYIGSFFGLLNPFALLLGVVGLVAFLLQGAIYTLLKTEGELHQRAKKIGSILSIALLMLWILGGLGAKVFSPHLFNNFGTYPFLYLIPFLTFISIAAVPHYIYRNGFGKAFIASSSIIATMILTLGAGIFPNWVIAQNPAYNLTIYNASSSPLTLKIMFIIAMIGMPIVILYTSYIYYVFRGKASPYRSGY